MNKLYFIKCCCCFVMLFLSLEGFAQYAIASNKLKLQTAALATGNPNEENRVALKDVLENLQKLYKIKIAYQEGLLNGKYVGASSADLKLENAEAYLDLLLPPLQLNYKKINSSQFSIFTRQVSEVNITQTVKGQVVFEDQSPAPGVSITLKADRTIGTSTDGNGNFSLTVPDKYNGQTIVLVASFIGYKSIEYTVAGSQPVLIRLAKSAEQLNEVVVTALGINKVSRSIGYASTEVKGSEFTQARENNVANALTGKVAGVNASGLSTGPGGSSRVIIRGNGSLNPNTNNQPLYVINGMPMDNSTPGGSATTSGGGTNIDRGDGIAAINPDDIETISVLKGGAAAALYGSRASNGVILITTKKGRAQKGVGVEYNGTGTIETIAVKPDFQYDYGQGDGGVKPTTLAAAQSTGRRSWGSKIDESTDYVGVDGLTHPYVAQKNNLQNYYRNGLTWTNTLALTGGSDAMNFRLSISDLNSKGLLPTTTYDRKTGNLAVNGKLGKKLSYEALAQYNLETGVNRTSAGDATANPNWSPYMIANTADVRWLAPGYDANGNETVWNDASVATNGYFVQNKFKENDKKNRFIGQATINYEVLKNLVIRGTVNQDHYDYNWTTITPTGTLYALQGQYSGLKSDLTETNGLATINYKGNVKDFGFNILAGVNRMHREQNDINLSGNNFIIPYFYSFNNIQSPTTLAALYRQEVNSVLGSADLSYKSVFYVSVTGRNDWFSTLSPASNKIFYPGVSSSLILSDIFKMPLFNSLKLKGSYAKVGGGYPEPYAINLTYSNVPSSGPSLQNVTPNTVGSNITGISNPNLKPYTSTTSEGGIEGQMLNNRLSFDITYYNRLTENDQVNATISGASGYNGVILNTGKIRNRGIELLISGTPVRSANFSWNTSYNIAYNDNKILQLTNDPTVTNLNVAATVGNWGNINNITGYSSFEIVGTRMLKNANGNTVFNTSSGFPVQTAYVPLGRSVPPVTMGFSNTFRYKRFSLDVLLDGKFGNKVFSIAEVYETRLGLLKTTLPGRDNGLVLNGVDQAGNAYTRTVPVSGLRGYYDNYKNYSELFLHDGSFVKLRQVLLSYGIPVQSLKFLNIQSASISFVARNLAILYKKTPGFDPESSYSNSNFQGLESISLPRARSFGLNLSVKF